MSFYTEQESTYKRVGVIGCGAAGGFVSVLLLKNPYIKITSFDIKEPFSSLIPTGGGRCNISFNEPDIKEFVKNYPRGEKFLLSVFSKFDVTSTLKLFSDLGIKTYSQEDKRIFPVSESSKKTVEILSKHLISDNFSFIKERVKNVQKSNDVFIVKTDKEEFTFDTLIVATGGKGSGFDIAREFEHNIIELKPSLCSIDVREKFLYNLPGMTFKNVRINFKTDKKQEIYGDILFTDKSITGPGIFKVSALSAYYAYDEKNPLTIKIKLIDTEKELIEKAISTNQRKSIKSVFSEFAPENLIRIFCEEYNIDLSKQVSQIKKEEKNKLISSLLELELHVISRIKGSEIVTAGGVDLKEIDAKTMMSKKVENLYFIGEMLNIDGFTGGFNLQNCWSGAYLCARNII